MTELTIGYPCTCYGTRRVSHALPTEPHGITYRRVRRLPVHRLPGAPPYWHYTCRFVPKPRVDAVHLFNRVCLSRMPWMVSFEMEYPRYFGHVAQLTFEDAYERMTHDECRLLMPMSIAAKEHFLRRVPDKYLAAIEPKVHVFTGGVAVPEEARNRRAARCQEKPAGFRLGFIGRDFWRKGGPAVLAATRALRDNSDDVRLLLISGLQADKYVSHVSDDTRRRVEQEIKDSPWIEWYPDLPNDQALCLLADCDACAFPTLDESLGWVILEAKALGLPVLTTNVFAIPELVEHELEGRITRLPLDRDLRWCGIPSLGDESRYPYNDAIDCITQTIVESVLLLIHNRSLCVKMGRCAQRRFQEQHHETVAAQKLAALVCAAF